MKPYIEPQPSSRNILFMKHLSAVRKVKKHFKDRTTEKDQKLITNYLHFCNARPFQSLSAALSTECSHESQEQGTKSAKMLSLIQSP